MTQWGTFEYIDALDKDPMMPFVDLFNKYDSEGRLELPKDVNWRTDPPAQWNSDEKNLKDLAPLIAQYFEKEIFPEWMVDRYHWKQPKVCEKEGISNQKHPSNDLGVGTKLRGETTYYGGGVNKV